MEHHSSLLSLTIVVILAFVIPITLQRFRLNAIPVVVAEILAGILVGKSGLNIVHPGMWLEVLSTLGFIFLMFLSGLEIDFSLFRQKRKNSKEPHSFQTATIIFILIFALSYALSLLFVKLGFVSNSLFMTLIISTVSLGVVVPSLKEGNISKTPIGQTILLTAVVADLVTMILLAVFVGLYSPEGQSMWLLLLLFVAGVLLYVIARRIQGLSYIENLRRGSIQIDTRAVFALILLLVGVSEKVGAENILGAFLAGVLVSLLSPNHEMMEKLESIGYGFFIPIFFVMVGINLELWSIFTNPSSMVLIPLLLVGLFLSKFIPSLILRKWYGWDVVVGSSLLLTSTLSLVIAAAQIGERLDIIEESLSAALVLSAVVTCIIAPILFKKVFPRQATIQKRMTIIGTDRLTLSLALDLVHEGYDISLFSDGQFKQVIKKREQSSVKLHALESYAISQLESAQAFSTEHLLIATNADDKNLSLALHAKQRGVAHVVARIEDVFLQTEAKEADIKVFSPSHAEQLLLKMLMSNPSLLQLMQGPHEPLREITLTSYKHDGLPIKQLPTLGDVLILQIIRGTQAIIPHGDTKLHYKDILLVTGPKEDLDVLEQLLT